MEDFRDVITKYQLLKDEGNRFFRTKDYHMAISRHEKSPQYLCVVVSESDDDVRLMEELAISLNLNLAACWQIDIDIDSTAVLTSPVEVNPCDSSNLCSLCQAGCSSQLSLHHGELDEFGDFSELDLRIDERKKERALGERNDRPLNQGACQDSINIEVSVGM
ncbi:hypothetical protein Cgig2_013503 [Carnegiea gigantea]|uniref:Uncharacterized protein n=1 Tax=Carnegiea gigantea TaxID=171969 RepID=A0A9Q1QBP6_9CARY|nr:hypothetical protein Cgig2_013503 [Carnegiea gigantea]